MFHDTRLIETLKNIPWFFELKPASFERLLSIAELRELPAGQILFREGERAVDFYIILSGQMVIETLVPCHGNIPTFTAGALDVVGWSCLTAFTRQRANSARAITDCRLIAMNGEALRIMCDEDHDLGYIITRRLVNIIASHMLTTRLHLYDIIVQGSQERVKRSP
ncbi:MAG: cyclic nucleotide-binding domain-containing protein [Anaerolineaceae bacterium]|jgi:CRP-like cAMP-binding protein